MGEFEAEWKRRITEAEQRARSSGRTAVADYLALRATNDTARSIGIDWLIETFVALAGETNRSGASSISITRDEAHRFRVGNSTMVGTLLTLRAGPVRALMIEAGWPRAPQDGIVRGGGLASARLRHFGNKSADEELLLTRMGGPETLSQWLVLDKSGARLELLENRLRQHIIKLLG